jgi:hypothetical protein
MGEKVKNMKKMPINSYFLKEVDCWPGNFFFGVAQHGAEELSSVSISDATTFHYTHYTYTHTKVIQNTILPITLNIVQFIIYKTH